MPYTPEQFEEMSGKLGIVTRRNREIYRRPAGSGRVFPLFNIGGWACTSRGIARTW